MGQLEASSQSTVALGTLHEMQSSQSGPPSPAPGCLAADAACPWSSACFPAQAALFLGAPTYSSISEKDS